MFSLFLCHTLLEREMIDYVREILGGKRVELTVRCLQLKNIRFALMHVSIDLNPLFLGDSLIGNDFFEPCYAANHGRCVGCDNSVAVFHNEVIVEIDVDNIARRTIRRARRFEGGGLIGGDGIGKLDALNGGKRRV